MFWDIFIVHPVRLQINEDRLREIQKYHKPTCLNVSVCCFELFANERSGVGGKIPTLSLYRKHKWIKVQQKMNVNAQSWQWQNRGGFFSEVLLLYAITTLLCEEAVTPLLCLGGYLNKILPQGRQ